MSSEPLIAALSSDLAPVRRRNMVHEAGLVLSLGTVELALFLGMGAMRPDMGHMTAPPFLMWRVGALGLLAIAACIMALRSFSPTARPRRGLAIAGALAVLAIVSGAFVAPPDVVAASLLQRIDPASGIVCATAIFVLSLPVVALLGVLMRRAAPTQPRLSALASGIAAGTCGAFVFAFCCPFNDPLYVVVWYGIGCAAVAVAARWLLPRRFRL